MSPEPHKSRLTWAERERQGDLRWIGDNLHLFWPAASKAFVTAGRGAIVVDTTTQLAPGLGNPFAYFTLADLEQTGDEHTRRMAQAYNPQQELVLVLLKSSGRTSTYHVQLPFSAQSTP
jgi:hypothetical protein